MQVTYALTEVVVKFDPLKNVTAGWGPMGPVVRPLVTTILGILLAGALTFAIARFFAAIPKVSLARGQGLPWHEHLGNQEAIGAGMAVVAVVVAVPFVRILLNI